MTKTNIPGRILLLTTLLVSTLVCSVLVALDIAANVMMIGAVACSGAGVTVWLVMIFKPAMQPWQSPRGTQDGKGGGPGHLSGADGYSAITDEVLGGRTCCKDAVRVCYELAARLSCARQIAQSTGTSVLGGIDDVRSKCLVLRDSLSKLCGAVERMNSSAETSTQLALGAASDSNGVESVPPALRSVLDEVIAAVRDMADTLRDVDQNAKDLITSTEETAYSMSRLDSFLQDMANSGKDLESSTDTANRVALEGTKVVGEMAKENEAIIATVKEAAAAVGDLGRWSQEVGKIVEVISDIADETNLLALNAAIIAAQSGEHGKAFGVVAEEIRGLAERTSSSTHEISDLVKTVQENVANVVQGMKKSLQRVERGELLTRNAGMVLEKVFESFESARSMAKQIATSTFEHKIDSSHVVRSIQRVTDIAKRLEAHQFSKWTTAAETVATARMIKALTQGAGTAALGQGGSDRVQTAADLVSSTCALGSDHDLSSFISRSEEDLGRSLSSLESMRENMALCMAAFDDIAGAVRSAVRQIQVETDGHGIRRCWEITGCDETLRSRCQAHNQDDWRCFLSDGVACSFAGNGDAHAERRCHECPAFKNNLEAMLTQMVHS